MRVNVLLQLSVLLAATASAAPAPQGTSVPVEPSADTGEAQSQLDQLLNAAADVAQNDISSGENEKRDGCTLSNLAIRREWGALSKKERKSYVTAVKCLQAKAAKTPSILVPGAKSRFDDFIATHINQTNFIHYTGNFLAWHRYFTWHYEQALRNECGYTGYQPYWDWAKTAASGLEKSPIFDGSDTSMSGNGEYIANKGNIILGGGSLDFITLPSGTGGGCVKSGPFKDMVANLGPVALSLPGGATDALPDQYAYNPRCLKRDLTDAINKRYANASSVVKLILKNNNINDFQLTMQGVPGSGDIGVHGGGHYSIGGDPARDLFVSPGDPIFYLHHGMIDRTWWMWQMLDKKNREKAIAGTNTFMNLPPSADTTLDDWVNLGYAGEPIQIRDLLSTTAGPFCYIYL